MCVCVCVCHHLLHKPPCHTSHSTRRALSLSPPCVIRDVVMPTASVWAGWEKNKPPLTTSYEPFPGPHPCPMRRHTQCPRRKSHHIPAIIHHTWASLKWINKNVSPHSLLNTTEVVFSCELSEVWNIWIQKEIAAVHSSISFLHCAWDHNILPTHNILLLIVFIVYCLYLWLCSQYSRSKSREFTKIKYLI